MPPFWTSSRDTAQGHPRHAVHDPMQWPILKLHRMFFASSSCTIGATQTMTLARHRSAVSIHLPYLLPPAAHQRIQQPPEPTLCTRQRTVSSSWALAVPALLAGPSCYRCCCCWWLNGCFRQLHAVGDPVKLASLPALHAAYLQLRQQHISSTHVCKVLPGLSCNLCERSACAEHSTA